MAKGSWIVDWLRCVGDPGEAWVEQFPKDSKTEFDVRFVIERSDKYGGHGVNIAIRRDDTSPLSPVLTYNILKGVYNAVLCTDMYGESMPKVLRNSDPAYDTFRTRLMDFPYRCILPLVNLIEPDDDGFAGLEEMVIHGPQADYGIVSGLVQTLGEIDLALFLSLELMHSREMLNAIPPGVKGFDIRYYGVGQFLIQACCMPVERTLKIAASLADPSYNPRRHGGHNSEVWRFIANRHLGVAQSIAECCNSLPAPWDELPFARLDEPLSRPLAIDDVGHILDVLDLDGGIYGRARYPHEIRKDLPVDEDGIFRQSQPHHDSALPALRVAVSTMAVIAKSLEQRDTDRDK